MIAFLSKFVDYVRKLTLRIALKPELGKPDFILVKLDCVSGLFFIFRSTQMIFQDADHALMTVTLFHKSVEDFKNRVNHLS